MIKSLSSPTLTDVTARLTSCFEHFTWAGHGFHSAEFTSYVSSGRTIPYNSQDGAIPKIAPRSGQHCASKLGKVRLILFKAFIHAVTNMHTHRTDSHVLYILGPQVSQLFDSATGDQGIRSQGRTQTLPSVSSHPVPNPTKLLLYLSNNLYQSYSR